MKDKIELKIISIDGKIIEDSVDEIYFDIPLSGVTGILPNRTPFAALLHIGIFYTKSNNQVKYYCISGGTLEFKNKISHSFILYLIVFYFKSFNLLIAFLSENNAFS